MVFWTVVFFINCAGATEQGDGIVDIYHTKRWIKKRESILRRDGYRCQESKRYGKNIQATTVHHIFPYEYFPEYAWCDWNLISLSDKMHNAMHDRDTHRLSDKGKELLIRTARKHGIDIPAPIYNL